MSSGAHIPAGEHDPRWRVSSHSGGQGNCLEVADNVPGLVPVRDSKVPGGPVIGFGRHAWRVFVEQLS